MGRYLGIDLGTKTIGLALSDPTHTIASSIGVIKRTKLNEDLVRLKKIIYENEVDSLIVGLPKNMDNSISAQTQRVLSFVDVLKKEFDIEVILQDERLSTISATNILMQQGVRRENRKNYVDGVAACIILQNYLDGKKWKIK